MAWRVDVAPTEVVETLRLALGAELIDEVRKEDLRTFVEYVRKHRYRRGEAIFHEDDLPGDIYIVAEGWVKHHQISNRGAQFTHRLSPVGDFFGRIAGDRRVGGTAALTDCALLVVNRERFLEFLGLVRSANVFLVLRNARRSAELLRKIHDLAFLNVPMRLASILLEVSEQVDFEGETKRVVPDFLNQFELALLVGASRESINQWLKHFARRKWITMNRRRIVIENEAALYQSTQ